MGTVVTRTISGKDRKDRVAIKVNPEAYEEKWGILEVTVTNYAWGAGSTSGDYGFVRLKAPRYNEDNDTIFLDDVALTTSGGTEVVAFKHYVSVNNGVVGPSAFVQPDGSWDLLHLYYEQPEDNVIDPGIAVTLTYSVAFTDLTPVSNPTDDGTLTLNVNNVKVQDQGFITEPATTFANKSGYVVAQINDLHLTAIDEPIEVNATVPSDSVPLFTVENDKTTSGSFTTQQVINHPTSKVSGDRTYQEKLMVFAINNGKADGNAKNVKASANYMSFLKVTLQKIANWPCDDWVTAITDYALDFTEVAP